MKQNRLFQRTRLRLAVWYELVMALILTLCGIGIYKPVSHAHWMTLDQEIEIEDFRNYLDTVKLTLAFGSPIAFIA